MLLARQVGVEQEVQRGLLELREPLEPLDLWELLVPRVPPDKRVRLEELVPVAKLDRPDRGDLTALLVLRVNLVRRGRQGSPVRRDCPEEQVPQVPPVLSALQEPQVQPEVLDSPVQQVLLVPAAPKDAPVQQVLPDLQEALDLQVELERLAL